MLLIESYRPIDTTIKFSPCTINSRRSEFAFTQAASIIFLCLGGEGSSPASSASSSASFKSSVHRRPSIPIFSLVQIGCSLSPRFPSAICLAFLPFTYKLVGMGKIRTWIDEELAAGDRCFECLYVYIGPTSTTPVYVCVYVSSVPERVHPDGFYFHHHVTSHPPSKLCQHRIENHLLSLFLVSSPHDSFIPFLVSVLVISFLPLSSHTHTHTLSLSTRPTSHHSISYTASPSPNSRYFTRQATSLIPSSLISFS
jgi:hypothetical protein